MKYNYKKIDNLTEYTNKMIASGAPIVLAEKMGKIIARPGIVGERIISWSVDSKGNEILEKEAVVELDENGIPGWVVTKIDDEGRIIIDVKGHNNCWIIDNEVFVRKYVEDTRNTGIYKPVGEIQRFIKLEEAIHVEQWGEEWNIDLGGYINITQTDDYYCISKRDFEDTYLMIR